MVILDHEHNRIVYFHHELQYLSKSGVFYDDFFFKLNKKKLLSLRKPIQLAFAHSPMVSGGDRALFVAECCLLTSTADLI